jgi:AcrR family transcriptional regulator
VAGSFFAGDLTAPPRAVHDPESSLPPLDIRLVSMSPPPAEGARKRNHATRDRLLDATEAIVANGGYGAPSHRTIGQKAGVHTALVGYHFGTKELLYEAMIGRRAGELTARWKKAIAAAREKTPLTAEQVLAAYWAPFGAEDAFGSSAWRNYLCSVAWLSQAGDGAAGWERHFDPVEREFRQALADALPHLNAEEIRRGFRYARELLDSVLLHRCESTESACGTTAPEGLRDKDIDTLIAFLAAGLRGLPYARMTAKKATEEARVDASVG